MWNTMYDTYAICCRLFIFFFFQAEDGIRDYKVTGVQTCALPICRSPALAVASDPDRRVGCGGPDGRNGGHDRVAVRLGVRVRQYLPDQSLRTEIGRASCRERV